MKTDQWIGIGTVLIVVLFLATQLANYWSADAAYALALNYSQAGQAVNSFQKLQEAITAMPDEPLYRDQMSQVAATMALAAAQEQNATLSAQLANISIQSSNTAVADSPNNPTFWRNRAKVFYSLATIDSKVLPTALEAILKAVDLAPTDAKVHYFAGLLYEAAGQQEPAIKMLEETRDLKINYRDARFELAKLYLATGKTDLAKAEGTFIITHIGDDTEVKKWLEDNKL